MGIIPARAGFTRRPRWRAPRPTDHPRSRGVYPAQSGPPPHSTGSSPLARGLPRRVLRAARGRGIIPARAGFTRSSRTQTTGRRDHPRSRGVYRRSLRMGRTWIGSSPLARGLRGAALRIPRRPGIIPARAGFTLHRRRDRSQHADHPRSRGVYPQQRPRSPSPWGSSPLARGLPKEGSDQAAPSRIIPARAGFTRHRVRVLLQRPDHPRSRGVYPAMTPSLEGGPGSSPLARGLRCSLTGKRFTEGIIPARAGFTSKGDQESSGRRDHPRSRGVYPTTAELNKGLHGSSPLARGLRKPSTDTTPPSRIIPARAGFTDAGMASAAMPSDHPRSRGVYGCSWTR